MFNPTPPTQLSLLNYRTTTSTFSGTTTASGSASIPFNISDATVGYTVAVNVSVSGATCSSSFTPIS